MDAETAEAQLDRARRERDRGNSVIARRLFDDICSKASGDLPGRAALGLAILEESAGNVGQALVLLRNAESWGPTLVTRKALQNIGRLKDAEGLPLEARDSFERAAEVAEDDQFRSLELFFAASMSSKLGETEYMIALLREVCLLGGSYAPLAALKLGVYALKENDLEAAAAHLKDATSGEDPATSGRAAVGLGNISVQQNEPGEARLWYERAQRTGDAYSTGLAQAMLEYLDTSNGDEAMRKMWNQYLSYMVSEG
jgi:tetratricopeptide (TPR) repeat protein